MNRAERRALEKVRRKNPPKHPLIGVPADCGMSEGDLITIRGHRLMPDGSHITDCEPGAETVFQVRVQ